MASTLFSDMVIPENFVPYVEVNSTDKTELWQSGVVQTVSLPISKGGLTVKMPFLNDLNGDLQILSGSTPLTISNVGSGEQIAAVCARGAAFGQNELASTFSGADIMGHIAGRLGNYWARGLQKQFVATLKGITANTSFAATNVYDISANANAAANFSTVEFINAETKLGDARDTLSAVAIHSSVTAAMRKLNLNEFQPASQQTDFDTYRGYRLIEYDGLAPVNGVYTAYLLGQGAFGFSDGAGLHTYETFRDILKGEDQIAGRRHYTLHPQGFKWVGSPAADTPSDAEFATGSNWTPVVDQKLIKVVAFKFKLGQS